MENRITENNRTTDWFFDFPSLPKWDVRERIPFVYDRFHYLPQSDTLCCIYSIAEVRMGWYQGFLAILKNKDNPELFLNITEKISFCDNFSANKNGNIIFLQANDTANSISCPILILDTERKKFSYYNTKNYNPCYKVIEINEHLFGMKADEAQIKTSKTLNSLTRKKIDLQTLKWYDFSELNTLPERVNEKGRFSLFRRN